MKKYARYRKPGRVKDFRTRRAELLVRRPNLFDWSFSFEPIPVGSEQSIVFVRSLLNRKGCKIAFRQDIPGIVRHIKWIAGMYGASCSIETPTITSLVDNQRTPIKINVITLRTNKTAREKAWLDVRVLRELQRAAKQKKVISRKALCLKLGSTPQKLGYCLERIDTITPEFAKELQSDYLKP